jgi:NADP-dependent 3-hydroxy acid dehydrogenase YdfG
MSRSPEEAGTVVDDPRVAVVTGAASGLGLGLATGLAARGMRVVIADIDSEALTQAENQLAAGGAEVLAVPTDVTRSQAVATLAERTLERFGRVDVVCLNAGVSLGGRAWKITLDDWRWIYDVNVFGVVHGIHYFVPTLISAGSGHVLITASNISVTTLPAMAPYVSSKHAVLAIAEALQQDLLAIGSDVGVSVSLPGTIRSGIFDAVRHRPPDYRGAAISDEVLRTGRAFLEEYGADPHTMAAEILRQALDERRFCFFTDPADIPTVMARAEAIRDGRLVRVTASTVERAGLTRARPGGSSDGRDDDLGPG